MDEDIQGQSIYLRWTNRQKRAIDGRRQTRAINIPTMDEDRQGQSIYLRWMKTDKGNQYTYDVRIDRQGQS